MQLRTGFFLCIMKSIEIWKDIPNYEGMYQVSSIGRVKSLKFGKEKILKQNLTKTGYYYIKLYNSDSKKIRTHQLVAMSFLNHKRCGYEVVVNHIDFNRRNNCICNLEIVTNRENTNQKHLKSISRYVGVSFEKKTNKWRAQIRIKGKSRYLGLHETELEAKIAYEKELINLQTL